MVVAMLALSLAGCSGPTGAGGDVTTATGSPGSRPVRVVVIGDSLIHPENGCPEGCAGFAQQFTDHVAQATGRKAELRLVTAMGLPEAVEAVSGTAASARTIASADVVVVEVGFNNALPDPETGIGCKTWFLDTDEGCLVEGVKTYGGLYDQVLAGVKALRAGRPTAYVVTTTVDANIAPADAFPDGLLALDAAKSDELKAWAVTAYERWNTMLRERAQAAGFQIVDLATAFNGADGTTSYYPELSDDGAHPNAAGNDVIASSLATADLSVIDR